MNLRNLVIGAILLCTLVLHIHNATLYDPLHGFDGLGHIEYFEYIKSHQKLPLPHEGWQYYQTPLYYILGLPSYLLGGIQAVQYQNILYYLIFLLVVYLAAKNLFPQNHDLAIVAMYALASLPVVNYLVPMISNEFLNDLFLGSALLYMVIAPSSIINILLLTLGFYTKYTIFTLGPAYFVALWQARGKNISLMILYGSLFVLTISPIILRNIYHYKVPLAMAESFFPFPPGREARDLGFFTNLAWITKRDMFQAHHYSFIGGTWNTFWHDGYQTTIPVVAFHKMAFGLWLLGFPLTIIAILGWTKLKMSKPKIFNVMMTYLGSGIIAYILYNYHLPYPSELKAFFVSGLPVVYVLGMVGAYQAYPKARYFILALLTIQFCLMLSYFWIQPWWHVAK